MKEQIYTSVPVNKYAGMGITQSEETKTKDQIEYENLKKQVTTMQEQLGSLPKKSKKRKFLAGEWRRKKEELREIKERMKEDGKSYHNLRGFQYVLLDVVKERVTRYQWKTFVMEAERRIDEAKNILEVEE